MVIYGDILFILNMIIDYLLIGLVASFIKQPVRLYRRLIAAAVGGFSAFYIFVESGIILIDLLFRLVSALLIVLISFGRRNSKSVIKALFTYYIFAVLLSGIAIILSNRLSANIIKVNNTYYYVGISPVMLISISTVIYLVLVIFLRIRNGFISDYECEISLTFKDKTVRGRGLIDSGNSVVDILSDSQVFISSSKFFSKLFACQIEDFFSSDSNFDRLRLIPAKTVSGDIILKAVRCDKAKITVGIREYDFIKPILAVSQNMAGDNYDIIIPKTAIEG